jgi:hypothetical protein
VEGYDVDFQRDLEEHPEKYELVYDEPLPPTLNNLKDPKFHGNDTLALAKANTEVQMSPGAQNSKINTQEIIDKPEATKSLNDMINEARASHMNGDGSSVVVGVPRLSTQEDGTHIL